MQVIDDGLFRDQGLKAGVLTSDPQFLKVVPEGKNKRGHKTAS